MKKQGQITIKNARNMSISGQAKSSDTVRHRRASLVRAQRGQVLAEYVAVAFFMMLAFYVSVFGLQFDTDSGAIDNNSTNPGLVGADAGAEIHERKYMNVLAVPMNKME